MSRLIRCALFGLSTTFLGSAAFAAEWPQFRGPQGHGIASSGEYPVEFGPDTGVEWKTSIPRGVSSPCIAGNRIFLTALDTTDQPSLETICLDRSTGDILWRKAANTAQIERVHKSSSPANSTPATDGERVYVYFASGGLLCYDLDGNELWRQKLPVPRTRFGNGTSPIVSGDTVFLRRQRKLCAFDSKTGEPRWEKSGVRGTLYTTPAIWNDGEKDRLLLLTSGRFATYDVATGNELSFLGGLPGQACATPQVIGGRVILSVTGMFGEPDNFVGLPKYEDVLKEHDKNEDDKLQVDEVPRDTVIVDRRASGGAGNSPLGLFGRGLDPNGDKVVTAKEWEQFSKQLTAFMSLPPSLMSVSLSGEGKLEPVWKQGRGVSEVPTPLCYEGRVYTVRNGGIVHCRDLETGEEVFRGRLGETGGYYASPVAGDGKIYFASDRGGVVVIAAGDALKILARHKFGEPIKATPALVESRIYLRTASALYAIGG